MTVRKATFQTMAKKGEQLYVPDILEVSRSLDTINKTLVGVIGMEMLTRLYRDLNRNSDNPSQSLYAMCFGEIATNKASQLCTLPTGSNNSVTDAYAILQNPKVHYIECISNLSHERTKSGALQGFHHYKHKKKLVSN
jgi:hypothetical protein